MRQSRINPKLSAYAQLNGIHDYNAHPVAPPGIQVLIHEKSNVRKTWSLHGVEGWYLGPAMEHYRCYRVIASKTGGEIITDTIQFFPHDIPMPGSSAADRAVEAAIELTDAISNFKHASPLKDMPSPQLAALTKLATIFKIATCADNTQIPQQNNMQSSPRVQTPRVKTTPPPASHPISEPMTPMPPPSTKVKNIPQLRIPAPRVPTPGEITPKIHVITDPDRTTPTLQQHSPQKRGTAHIIPPDVQPWESTQKYIHKYNTRSSPEYAFAAAILQQNACMSTFPSSPQFINHALHPNTGAVCSYKRLATGTVPGQSAAVWEKGLANEFGRLANGVGTRMPKGSNTIAFISKQQVPADRKVTYGNMVCDIRPQKAETHRVRLTVGGDQIQYPGNASTPTADLTTAKCLVNSILSTKNAKGLCADIKDFYLTSNEMERFEYMKVKADIIPDEIMQQYMLEPMVTDGWVYIEIRKGMYGLPQAGLLANLKLTKHLATHGYHPTKYTPGLWKHESKSIAFTLTVDDFFIKYTNRKDADHLLNALKEQYVISEDWEAKLYCGVTFEWDYKLRTCILSMPDYVANALKSFQHTPPTKAQHAPHPWTKPVYGQKVQLTEDEDESDPLNPTEVNVIQKVIVKFYWYARAIEHTMLVALSELSTKQTEGVAIKKVAEDVAHFLNYASTHPTAAIKYHASGMCLHIDSDASYLSVRKARSRVGGHFILVPHRQTAKNPLLKSLLQMDHYTQYAPS